MSAERPLDPALLLHGQPGNAGDWDRVRGAIGGRVPTIALDRPGWDGRSGPSDLRGNVEAALAAPLAGYLASAASLAGLGVALATGPIRRRIAEELALDDRYLQGRVPLLLTPRAWRAYAAEQRVLVRDLPLLEQRLGNIQAPTTIIGGTADRIVPNNSVRRLTEQIPGAELVVIEHAGHLLPLQESERLADLIVMAGQR